MGYYKVAKEYRTAFEQGNIKKAKEILMAHPGFWKDIKKCYEMRLGLKAIEKMPGCREKLLNQKDFLEQIINDSGK